MNQVQLENLTNDHKLITATFTPLQGMNLISYKKNAIEAIDQSTLPLFQERSAGLGALIGPHFHRKKDSELPRAFDESLFPHIAKVKANGVNDPFSHGIARYAPWKYVCSKTQIQATLSSKDKWHGIPLSTLEGQEFEMTLNIRLLPTGLFIRYGITSERPSVIGLHYYYHLPEKTGLITGDITPKYRDLESWKPIPKEWIENNPSHLHFTLEEAADYGFHPREDLHENRMILTTNTHELHILYGSPSEKESSCQIYHPKGASFVCIEPLTALNPREPTLNHSILETKIEII
ncbi:MAG: hypothetical protein KAR79_02485 [Simkaniaceae bacterium]|nr:hypothetical protein [Simkaniaceae bacterium]